MSKRVAIKTFGCRANQYDTGVLIDRLKKASFEIVDFEDEADFYVINSCTVTHRADVDVRQSVHRAQRINPQAKTIVMGCSAEVNPDIYSRMSEVHHVVKSDAQDSLVQLMVSDAVTSDQPENKPDRQNIYFGGGVTLPKHSRSFLKIQDGCSQFCSFCIVPFSRGSNRSVDPSKIMDSLFELRDKGICEVVLTGIHLGTYGRDLKPQTTLYDLLQRIEREKPVSRVRISSVDPEELSDEMIELLAGSHLYCHHLHLPLQSGDDHVLKQMRRRYTARYFADLCERLLQHMPDMCLGTDVLVGFPGEGKKEFQNTISFLHEAPIAYIHTFPYSARKGTRAALFQDHVDSAEKARRASTVRELSDKKRHDFHRRFLGRELKAVLERRKGGICGLTGNYISIEILGESDYPLGQLVDIQIETVSHQGVQGIICQSY